MKQSPFTLQFDKLPREIPIFPLSGVAVMPGTQLPLNIFEPRYLQMVFDVLGGHRMIGMVQPTSTDDESGVPEVYRTGTAGRITSFSESKDGRLMILLTGVCRFDITEELSREVPYRNVIADWARFHADYGTDEGHIPDRRYLFTSLRTYCDKQSVEISWKEAEELGDKDLVDLLTVHLPLEIQDKQALIESVHLDERISLLQGLLEMTNALEGDASHIRH